MINRLLSGRRVLVVEDEMMLLLMIDGMLADMGCESVSAAATVKQALAMIEAQTFDVAMLDLNLNGDRSYLVADELAARGVPFLFATGYSSQSVIDGFGDNPVLRKPYRFEDLVSTLERLIYPDRFRPAAA